MSEFSIQKINSQPLQLESSSAVESPLKLKDAAGGDDAATSSFLQYLKEGLASVNQTQQDSDKAVREMMAGSTKNIHEAMLFLEKADMTYKMAMQVRNKIIDAYREVMRMQV